MRLSGYLTGNAGGNAFEIILNAIAIVFEDTLPLNVQYSQDAFFHDAFVHFGHAQFAVDESDGYFLYLKSQFPGREFHFYLESITDKGDFVEVDGFQHFAFVTHETSRGIFYLASRL